MTSVVEVEDDGPGIPDAEKDKVFTRFYRLSRDQSPRRKRVGAGHRSIARGDAQCRDRRMSAGAMVHPVCESGSHGSDAAVLSWDGYLEVSVADNCLKAAPIMIRALPEEASIPERQTINNYDGGDNGHTTPGW